MENDGYRGIWVFAEQREGRLKGVAYELLAKGRELANSLHTELSAVCFGHKVDEVSLIAHGADKVFLVDSPEFANNQEAVYTRLHTELNRQNTP